MIVSMRAVTKNRVPGYFFSTVIGSERSELRSNVTPSASHCMSNISRKTVSRYSLSILILEAMKSMSMDIGFGDVVSPCPMSLDYPLLLTNIPSIQIQAYSLETVIAEKFHTMIDRDVSNSRMKDFYDCHQLLTRHHINDQTLYDAICATFDNRQLEYNPDLQLFTPEFAADAKRNVRWNSFLKKINVVDAVTFQETMCVIIDRLYPLYTQYWLQNKRV